MLVRISAAQQRLDLSLGRHRRRALKPRGYNRTSCVGVLQYLLQRPTCEQSMTQGPTERVTCAEAVQWPNRNGRRLHPLASGLGQYPLRALLHDGQLDSSGKQSIRGLLRLGFADSDLTLLPVTNRHRDERQRLLHLRSEEHT